MRVVQLVEQAIEQRQFAGPSPLDRDLPIGARRSRAQRERASGAVVAHHAVDQGPVDHCGADGERVLDAFAGPMQAVRRVTQYGIARPCREICFTVVEQESRYKAKNVIDTVVYRFGDLSSAWVQAGLRALGFGIGGSLAAGVVASGLWALSAWRLGRGYERRRPEG